VAPNGWSGVLAEGCGVTDKDGVLALREGLFRLSLLGLSLAILIGEEYVDECDNSWRHCVGDKKQYLMSRRIRRLSKECLVGT
jgi:hypothetical protein